MNASMAACWFIMLPTSPYCLMDRVGSRRSAGHQEMARGSYELLNAGVGGREDY